MVFRIPSFNARSGLRRSVNMAGGQFSYGPQAMNIAQPLSRATTVAERSMVSQSRRRNTQGYSYPFPKIPRPKRNAQYYTTWTNGRLFPSKQRLRIPDIRLSRRSLSVANQKIKSKTKNLHKRFFSAEARKRRQQRRRFIKWWTLTSLTVVLGGVAAKIRYEKGEDGDEQDIKPQSWHLYAYSTLPLKSISRLWGQVNSIDLPVWLRSPSYKFYSTIFGVNLDEIDEPDLTTYNNLSEFFYRKLKPGARPIDDGDIVSPADGKVLKFGVVENGEIEQVKGMTYSIDALLGLTSTRLAAPSHSLKFDRESDENAVLRRDEEFAKINGISYSMDDILGGEGGSTYHKSELHYKDKGDGTAKGSESSISKEISVARKLAPSARDVVKSSPDKQLFFAVIYLAPGDYHRYHSPTNWVTTLRRHFVGELFSVAPFFQKTLDGLFVLNERVALLGYWKYGFFSMIPVGATNVGSIVVNFDKDLKTNDIYEHEVYRRPSTDDLPESAQLLDSAGSSSSQVSISDSSSVSTSTASSYDASKPRRSKKNTIYEATYTNASRVLGGYPLSIGQEIGGFKLGSTVVLVFEAPENFKFNLRNGEKVRVGQSLGSFD